MGIYVDGKLVAKLATKERATFKIPAGEVVLGAGVIGGGLCGSAADRQSELPLVPGKPRNTGSSSAARQTSTSCQAPFDIKRHRVAFSCFKTDHMIPLRPYDLPLRPALTTNWQPNIKDDHV